VLVSFPCLLTRAPGHIPPTAIGGMQLWQPCYLAAYWKLLAPYASLVQAQFWGHLVRPPRCVVLTCVAAAHDLVPGRRP
jgi:hypothetical protein